jgi:site-specific DNA recombinase
MITKELPSLRIVTDELWNAAKDRQSATRRTITSAGNIGFARRPRYLFSGLSKCGVCGAGFIMAGRNRLTCFGARDKGTCDNRLTIRRDEVEARVLKALEDKLLNQELFEEFCEEFTREMSAARLEQLETKLAATEEPPPHVHPEMARIYRMKVTELAKALQEPDSGSEATGALRRLVDAIVLTPDRAGETLQIELKGNLAAMLGATVQTKRSSESDDLFLQVSLVAGARNQHYLQLWRPAA